MNSGMTITFLAGIFFLNASSNAQIISPNDPYFQIKEIKTEVIQQRETQRPERVLERAHIAFIEQNPDLNLHGLEATHESVDPLAIADLLVKVWDLIVKSKPVATIDLKAANALPNLAANHWESLTGWQKERAVTYAMYVENGFGMKVVDLEYQVKLLYGGGVKGKGRYIASARVIPTKVEVLWAFNLDMSASVSSPVNLGSERDPLAALYLDVNYRIHNTFSTSNENQSYLLQGDGMMMNTKSQKVYFQGLARNSTQR